MSEPMLILDLARGRRVQVTRKEIDGWAGLVAVLDGLDVPRPFKVEYEDADGDRIVCGETDAELEAAFASAEAAPFQEVVLRVRGHGEADSAVADDEYEVLSMRDASDSLAGETPSRSESHREESVVAPMFVPSDAAAGQSVELVEEDEEEEATAPPPPAFVGEEPASAPASPPPPPTPVAPALPTQTIDNSIPMACLIEPPENPAPLDDDAGAAEEASAPAGGLEPPPASSPTTAAPAPSSVVASPTNSDNNSQWDRPSGALLSSSHAPAAPNDVRAVLATLLQDPACLDVVLKHATTPEARAAMLDVAREEARRPGEGLRVLRERHATTLLFLATRAVSDYPALSALISFLVPSFDASPAPPRPAHVGVECNSCCADAAALQASVAAGTHRTSDGAILGARYKSAVLYDFDLCETCETSNSGGHTARGAPFLKLSTPSKEPSAILCIFSESEDEEEVSADELATSASANSSNLRVGGEHAELQREFLAFLKARKRGRRNSVLARAAATASNAELNTSSSAALAASTVTSSVVETATSPTTAPAAASLYPAVPPAAHLSNATPVAQATLVQSPAAPPPPPPPPRVTSSTGCPGRHMLQRFITPHGGFVCNVCDRRQIAYTLMFGCRTCDYDACAPCHAQGGPSNPATAVAASPNAGLTSSAPYTVTYSTPQPQAKFLADVTLPDGTFLEPGKRAVKIWRVKNSSAVEAWPAGTRMVHVGGELLGGPVQGVPLPCVKPGNTVDVEIPLVMPTTPGRYTTYWRLAVGPPTHARFGHRFWAQLNVAAPAAPAAVETVAATTTTEPSAMTPPISSDLSQDLQLAVQQCLDFGFTDIDVIVDVLREVEGDVARAVDVLLSKP